MPGRADNRMVLIVEDDASMREAMESLLGLSGFDTVMYESAEAMLGAETAERPLCVISDLHLPVMSGLELLGELRRRHWQPPVIIITAHDSPATRREAARLGAVDYLAKPFPSISLLTAIEKIAAHARPQ